LLLLGVVEVDVPCTYSNNKMLPNFPKQLQNHVLKKPTIDPAIISPKANTKIKTNCMLNIVGFFYSMISCK
jgi:hypothetical protein